MCPFLDNKDVISRIQEVAKELKSENLNFIADNFCAIVQSQEDFETEFAQLRIKSVGPNVFIRKPSAEQLDAVHSRLDQRVEEKLKRAFPFDKHEKTISRKTQFIYSHVERENVLSDLREAFPDFWEASTECIAAEERRLEMAGAEGDTAPQQISSSMDKVAHALRTQVPSLTEKQISAISQGVVGTWLIECPLDFQESSENEF
ncbi:hypothetical protein [Roseibium sediminicola]|uniref:Uncharacterized protein n=1 Tax=Roseibium sediminicola TaxID=2933272 RepID=A0ABT0GTW7_9HYPH|nr:hypothetical protein [Roseibium sp. CAU 1639]MCK7612253.1 hypothetical protein [Roseibium sp. CAU 1639]